MDKQSVPPSSPASRSGHAAHAARARASRRHRVWFIVVFSVLGLVALGLRLEVAWHRNHASPDDVAVRLDGDEPHYEALAYGLLHGSFFPSPLRVPVYPAFIAATYAVLGERSPAKLLYVQAFVGVLVVPLTYWLARRWTGRIPALGAAGMVGLDDRLIEQAGFLYSEVLYTPLLLGALLALLRAVQAPRWGPFAGAGVSMAVVTLCRPTTALFPLLLPLLVPRGWPRMRQVRAVLVYGVAMGVVIAPWTARNYQHYGRLVLIASEGGITFWTGNHPLSPGEGDMAANPAIKRDNQRLRAAYPGLTAEELEPIYYREAFVRIVSRPLWWIGLEVRKLFYLVVPIGPSYTLHSARYLTATLVSYGMLLPLGCAGLLALWRQRRTPVTIALWLLSVIVAALIFFPQERFRIPLIDPVLIAGAAAFIAHRIAPARAVEPQAQG